MTIDRIIAQYTENFPHDKEGQELIRSAYTFAHSAHKGQKRASGENYEIHVLATAYQLAEWKLDAQSIVGGLLHDTLEDCHTPPETIIEKFGEEILFLIEGVTKLSKLKYKGEERNVESLRKMILAISRDLRIIFIKLADRLHNMKTLKFLPPVKQKRIALETAEIYAPLASRLGMQNVSGELEDLAFPYTHPTQCEWIQTHVQESFEERSQYLKRIQPIVEKQLEKTKITPVSISNRAKRISSLYKKLLRYDMSIDRIYDLVAMRIIVHTVDECYLVLGAIHQLWRPMPGRIKDYIALPKPNGYQSLHTTVLCEENRPTEFQIRTVAMHEQSEYGAAAHWFYETRKGTGEYIKRKTAVAESREAFIVKQLHEWQNQFPGSQEFIDALKIDIFSDRIFALTPTGEAIDLPSGATPVDFAYAIHSEIGNQCVGAKVNNKIVSLDYHIQSGDMVEILTQRNKKPSESWMQFVKTRYATKKIKASLRKKIILPKKTEYKITCSPRIGMLKDISSVFSRNHVSILQSTTTSEGAHALIRMVVDISTKDRAEQILVKFKKMKDVKEINYKLVE